MNLARVNARNHEVARDRFAAILAMDAAGYGPTLIAQHLGVSRQRAWWLVRRAKMFRDRESVSQ